MSARLPLPAFPGPAGTPASPGRPRASQRLRRLAYGPPIWLAARVNEVFYEAAIRANRVQGWLVRHRDGQGRAR